MTKTEDGGEDVGDFFDELVPSLTMYESWPRIGSFPRRLGWGSERRLRGCIELHRNGERQYLLE